MSVAHVAERTPATLVSDEQLRRELSFAEEYDLSRYDRWVASLVQTIGSAPHAVAHQRLRAALVARLQPYHAWHEAVPFATLDGLDRGGLRLGAQLADQSPVTLGRELEHVLVYGPTGTGKSHLLAHLLRSVLEHQERAIVLDAKGDTPWMLQHDALSLSDLEFSLVACPPYASPTEFINRWLMHFRESFWTAELQSAVLLPILREVIHPGRAASLAEIVDRIRLRDKSPAGKAAADRLESISLSYPKLYESTANRWSELHEQSLYCPIIGTLTPATRFVTWLLIIERFAYLQHRAHRDRVHTVVFLDEAQTSLSKRTQTISGLPSTPVQLLPTTREHGLQFVVATPSWTELDPLVLSQFQVQIALQPSDGRELDAITKSFRLTPAQARLTSSMQRGTALGKIRGLGQPFLFTYEPFREQKDIAPATVSAARARAERFCNASNSSAREGIASNGQPTPAQESAPSSSPPSRVAPVVEQTIPPNTAKRTVSLNERERKILTYIAQRGVLLVTELHAELHLHAMQESRTRKNLRALGLIEEHRITTRSGRGGTSIALTLTQKAHEELHLAKAHLGKGGPAHRYYLRCLRDHLGATLEVEQTDAVIAYNSKRHERLQAALGIALNDGETIAIEVEVSNPRMTTPRIAARNNRFTHTIIATLPQHVEKLRTTHQHSSIVVINILALLDKVRP